MRRFRAFLNAGRRAVQEEPGVPGLWAGSLHYGEQSQVARQLLQSQACPCSSVLLPVSHQTSLSLNFPMCNVDSGLP